MKVSLDRHDAANPVQLLDDSGAPVEVVTQFLRHLMQLAGLRTAMLGGVTAAAAIEGARPPVFQRRRSAVEAQLRRWSMSDLAQARRRVAEAVALTRTQPGLEIAAISVALHGLARQSRRLSRA